MRNETSDQLFELSYKTKTRGVTPILLDFLRLDYYGYGLKEEQIVKIIDRKYQKE